MPDDTAVLLDALAEAVRTGDAVAAERIATNALEEGTSASSLLDEALVPAMLTVGTAFSAGEIFVPEMLVAARAMKRALAVLQPHLVTTTHAHVGSIVLGTVQGDVHDIGKKIVAMMLEGTGFTVHDLGVGVRPDAFVDAVRETHPDLVGLSALLTTTMPAMKQVIEALERAGLRSQVKVIVGGAPLTEGYASAIGADGYARDGGRAVTLAKSLLAMSDRATEGP